MKSGSSVWMGCLSMLLCSLGCGSGEECEAGAYPALPNGATGAVHVSSVCPADGADGSAAHPFPEIGQAIAAARVGNAVLVAAGTYPENVTIDKTLSLVGPPGSERGEAAGIILQAPRPNAVTILGASDVFLQGIQVIGAKDAGIVVRGGSLTVDGAWISDTVAHTDPELGHGIMVRDSGSIILQNSSVTRSRSTGVLLYASHGIILQSTVSDNDGGGVRLDRSSEESTIQDSLLVNNVGFGVAVFGSKASLLRNEIRGVRLTTTGPLQNIADGILASGVQDEGFPTQLASVTAKGNTVVGAGRVGALFSHDTGQIILQNNHLQGNAQVAGFGAGIWLQQGAGSDPSSEISDNDIKDSRFVGIGVSGAGTSMVVRNNDILGVAMGTTQIGTSLVSLGDGIGVFGARARVTGNRISACDRIGIVLDGAGAGTQVTNNMVEQNVYGVIQQNQSPLDVAANTIQRNTTMNQYIVGVNEIPFDVKSDDFDTLVAP